MNSLLAMPQFDYINFSSQIFWLLLCFAVLYFFLSKVILPRIRDILADRRNLISQNISDGQSLKHQIDELQQKADKMRHESGAQYQEKIESALKAANKEREEAIENLKLKLDETAKEANRKVASFVEESMARSAAAVESVAKSIKAKIIL